MVIIPSDKNSWEISDVQVASRYTLGGGRAEAVAGMSSEVAALARLLTEQQTAGEFCMYMWRLPGLGAERLR